MAVIDKSTRPFSRLGIFSFIFGLMPLVGVILIVMGAGTPGRTPFILVVSGGATILFSAVFAFALGLATLFQKRTARVFGVVGFAFGLFWILSIVSLFVLFSAFIDALGIALGSGFGKM